MFKKIYNLRLNSPPVVTHYIYKQVGTKIYPGIREFAIPVKLLKMNITSFYNVKQMYRTQFIKIIKTYHPQFYIVRKGEN